MSGICLVGEMSVGHLFGRGNVRQGFVWSGKCPSGMCLVGEESVGKCALGICPGVVWDSPTLLNLLKKMLRKHNYLLIEKSKY